MVLTERRAGGAQAERNDPEKCNSFHHNRNLPGGKPLCGHRIRPIPRPLHPNRSSSPAIGLSESAHNRAFCYWLRECVVKVVRGSGEFLPSVAAGPQGRNSRFSQKMREMEYPVCAEAGAAISTGNPLQPEVAGGCGGGALA